MKLKFRWEIHLGENVNTRYVRLPYIKCPNCGAFTYTCYRDKILEDTFWSTNFTGKYTKPWFECHKCEYEKK